MSNTESSAAAASSDSPGVPQQMIGANFPKDAQGRVYHLQVKEGEVANRIIAVGDLGRAETFADLFFDAKTPVFKKLSSRGFAIYTGLYKDIPVSVIGTGMGIPMTDFAVRECRAIIKGKIAMIRVGTCGTPRTDVHLGDVVAATKGAIVVRRNVDAFYEDSNSEETPYYQISRPVMGDPVLSELMHKHLVQIIGKNFVKEGINASADSFYSSQGRIDQNFEDHNETLIDQLVQKYPELSSIEMETFHMFDLARCAKGSLACAGCGIVLAQRREDTFIKLNLKAEREKQAGQACFDAIIEYPLGN